MLLTRKLKISEKNLNEKKKAKRIVGVLKDDGIKMNTKWEFRSF